MFATGLLVPAEPRSSPLASFGASARSFVSAGALARRPRSRKRFEAVVRSARAQEAGPEERGNFTPGDEAAQRFTHGVRERVWVVAADRARARVFAVHRPDAEERLTTAEHPEDRFHARDRGLRSHPTEELHEFEDLVAPQSRLPERESRSDDSGRFASRPAPRTSASRRVGSPGQEDDVETERFARQLADTLEEARAAGRMDKFYFAAGPQFIGAFRKELGGRPALRGALVDEVKKSVVDMSTHAIREALGDDLRRR